MEKYLSEFKPNDKGRVKKLTTEGKLKRRLFDMGVTPGAKVVMRKVAPLGDPIEINIRGYELTIRKDEARAVLMETEGEM